MKSLFISIIILTTTYVLSSVQAQTEPFKGANVLEISSTLSDDELFTIVGKYLVSEGFDIESSNRDLGQIITVPRDNGKLLSYYHQYRFAIVNHKIRIKAFFGNSSEKAELENRYAKNSRFWSLIEEMAEGIKGNLPNSSTKYLKL